MLELNYRETPATTCRNQENLPSQNRAPSVKPSNYTVRRKNEKIAIERSCRMSFISLMVDDSVPSHGSLPIPRDNRIALAMRDGYDLMRCLRAEGDERPRIVSHWVTDIVVGVWLV